MCWISNRNRIRVVGRDQTRQPILLSTRRAVGIGKRSDCRRDGELAKAGEEEPVAMATIVAKCLG
jgi:hypothetical protein